MRSLCRALLVMNVLYCVLAAFQEGVPGWHMFESVEPLGHELRDRDWRVVDVRDYLPRGANLVDLSAEVIQVVAGKDVVVVSGEATAALPSRVA